MCLSCAAVVIKAKTEELPRGKRHYWSFVMNGQGDRMPRTHLLRFTAETCQIKKKGSLTEHRRERRARKKRLTVSDT